MATPKPQRSPQEVEDIILRKIFLVTLTESAETDPRIVYLELTAAEILSEGEDLRLSRDLLERVLIDRLSGSFQTAEPPFQYLIGCYRRAYDEGKKITAIKDKNLRSEMDNVVRQAKKLTVSYCRFIWRIRNYLAARVLVILLASQMFHRFCPHVFGEVASTVDGFVGAGTTEGVKPPPGFVEEFFRDSDFDSLEPVLKQLYEDLRGSELKVSALGNFQQPLRALMLLVSFPVGAKSLVNHPWWILRAYLNGRVIEMTSFLGPFFHVSGLPDHTIFKSQPDVGQQCFSEESNPKAS